MGKKYFHKERGNFRQNIQKKKLFIFPCKETALDLAR